MRAIAQLLAVLVAVLSVSIAASAESPHFVFVRIPEPIGPLDRAAKYEDPLNESLQAQELGEVTGGGSMLSAPKTDGSRDIEWVGVDVDLVDLDRGLALMKRKLVALKVPLGTVLEYESGGQNLELRLGTKGWAHHPSHANAPQQAAQPDTE